MSMTVSYSGSRAPQIPEQTRHVPERANLPDAARDAAYGNYQSARDRLWRLEDSGTAKPEDLAAAKAGYELARSAWLVFSKGLSPVEAASQLVERMLGKNHIG